MNLEKAAKALVECGYAENYERGTSVYYVLIRNSDSMYEELVDPINNEAQLFVLAFWFLLPDKTLTLTGDGHFDVKEQLQNFVEENLK